MEGDPPVKAVRGTKEIVNYPGISYAGLSDPRAKAKIYQVLLEKEVIKEANEDNYDCY